MSGKHASWSVLRSRTTARLAAGTLFVASLTLGAAGVASAAGKPAPPVKTSVTLCHATGSTSNPYITVTVDADGADGSLGSGQNNHNGHTGPIWTPGAPPNSWGDIIPPFAYAKGTNSGYNWTAAGQAIYANGCAVPSATPGGTPKALTLSVACAPTSGQALWTVGNPLGNPQVSALSVSAAAGNTIGALSATTLAAGDTATFTSNAPLSGTLSVTGSSTSGAVSSSAVGESDHCVTSTVVPASVSFIDTCSGIDATFTSANDHATVFSVTEPDGTTSTVTGSGSRSYAATAANHHLAVSYDTSGVAGHDWAAPASCGSNNGGSNNGGGNSGGGNTGGGNSGGGNNGGGIPGGGTTVAVPTVAASNACRTGITVTLGNVKGTAAAVFTLVAKGASQHITVPAGATVTKHFAVKEDTTGSVTVSAAGLATKTFRYAKNCTAVLGEKVTRTPHTSTGHKAPQVKGLQQERLPFTGVNSGQLLGLATVLFVGGLFLCVLGRKPRTAQAHSL